MQENYYCGVKDVMKITGLKESKAYQIIKQINEGLQEQGFITLKGKAPRAAVFDRLGLKDQDHELD